MSLIRINGNLLEEKNNCSYFENKKYTGEAIFYFKKTNTISMLLIYKNGILDGIGKYYNDDGQLIKELKYKDGELYGEHD